ncbi:MAG: LLM class flavin-dependent oxidoreductase [Deltaproteobacteria bacterium]|nr:LLM class flavin-dependent oxidoreductase [Deltaproteobacteria bacterium]MBW2722752.1 LLM class flavin-dependent oxidoreductase [Deltaproteobacteria bacterium]
MEFGILIHGYAPRDPHNNALEHDWVRRETELVQEADRCGFKYVWLTEHHFLEEYSHLSASEVFIPYLGALTERIHIGSGIFNLNPEVNHPARLAERVAMLDHLLDRRFEFGTGRGAGSYEIGGFGITDTNATREVWEEVIWEFRKMWEQTSYSHEGKAFSMPPRNVLPKPFHPGHPPMWVAAGNIATYEKAALHGLGVLGFNIASSEAMRAPVQAYKQAIKDANPVGAFVHDNVMVASRMLIDDSSDRAKELATKHGISYLDSLIYRYHDTFARPEGWPLWPETAPEPTLEDVLERIDQGFMLCGNPKEVAEQTQAYVDMGCDQVVFGLPFEIPHEDALNTIRLFGEHVLPKFDTDPVHRSTRCREGTLP